LSGSVSTGVFNSPQISYGFPQKTDDFFRAFGPLKISGHTLQASGSTLGITKTSGTSYREGAAYTSNPNHPSTVIEGAINTSKIYRYYLSGSTPIIDTGINNAGYTTLDNTKYVNISTGQLTSVSGGGNNQFTIQRVFWIPNSPTNAFIVYYGNGVYGSLLEAKNAIDTEPFTEAPNTSLNAIFLGDIIMEGDAVNLTTSGKSAIIQAGLFRSVGGVGASGVPSIAASLASLSDVNITGPTYGDLLMYDSTYWYNTKTLSGSYILSGSLTTNDGLNSISITSSNISASKITGSLFGTSSWATNVLSSSYATTASYALNGGGGATLITGSTYPITSSWSNNTISASYALNSLTSSYCLNPFPISGSLGYWGSFWDTTTQTNASSSNKMLLNTTDSNSNGVYIESGSRIKFVHDGVYNIQFSAVFTSDNASSNDVNVWFNKNNQVIENSNTVLTIAGQSNAIAAWNYVLKLQSNDYLELYWNSSELTIKLESLPSQSAAIPATPSLIVTATQVTNTQIAASASYAATASYYNGSVISSSYALSSSYAPINTNITSSWSNNSLTASYVVNAQSASYYNGSVVSSSYSLSSSYAPTNTNITTSWAQTSSNSINAQTASYLPTATYNITASWSNNSITSSYSTNSNSASYSLSSSYAPTNTNITASWSTNALTASGLITTNSYIITNLTASTISASGITSSNILITGNTFLGNQTSDTIFITGSVRISGSLTSSLFGTASHANQVNNFILDTNNNSLVIGNNTISSTPIESIFIGSYAGQNTTLSNGNVAIGSSTAFDLATGSRNTILGSFAGPQAYSQTLNDATVIGYLAGTNLGTGSNTIIIGAFSDAVDINDNVSGSILIGYNVTSNAANTTILGGTNIISTIIRGSITASAISASGGFTGSHFGTSSWANNVVSSSYALTASVLLGSIESASYAATASYSLNASGTELTTGSTYPITSSWANNVVNSISSSYATTASFVILTNTATGSINFGFTSSGENSFAETTILAPWVTTSSLIHIRVIPSNDHDRIDSLLDGLIFSTENIINGISFDIYCHALNNTWGTYNIVATEQKSNI